MECICVADTNLFFEYKRLEDLCWNTLGFEKIIIALTQPVLSEIDKHKRGNGRTRRLASDISKRVHDVLNSDEHQSIIKNSKPQVILQILPIIKPDLELENILDYENYDDKIIGIVSSLAKKFTGKNFLFFTGDVLAASKSHSVGVPFHIIEDTWRRPPEESAEAKKVKELEKEVIKYRSQEPDIIVQCKNEEIQNYIIIEKVKLLEDSDFSYLENKLKEKFPIKENFNILTGYLNNNIKSIISPPPSEEDIKNYKDEYNSWISSCLNDFKDLNKSYINNSSNLNLSFGIKNKGSRPAKFVRIQFEANGSIMLQRISSENKEIYENSINKKRSLSISKPPCLSHISRMRILQKIHKTKIDQELYPRMSDIVKRHSVLGIPQSLSSLLEKQKSLHENIYGASSSRRVPSNLAAQFYLPENLQKANKDKEKFYFKNWSSDIPVKIGIVTCDLFRHQIEEEIFEVMVLLPQNGEAHGAIVCTVHAENLTDPVSLRIPISRNCKTVSLLKIAETMIDTCE